MENFEKSGLFYLGKRIDLSRQQKDNELFLYESKNFTTHAVCVGMTGSGKTGLGIAIIEEAAIDKIPAIIIDPKGDLTNLLLTFPHLSPEEFLPWIDPAEAERKGVQPPAYAETIAKTWREGLAGWGEGPDRIQKLKNAVDMTIYTPASSAGMQISILNSFNAPSKELMLDNEAVRERVLSITSSLLGLLGINADPIKSREHILISTIISSSWNKEANLDLVSLIQQVQKPPFDKIGALDIDTFFPPKERVTLSIILNNLLASPGFHAWMEGDPLDIQTLLYNKDGKPKLSILSIAHLSDPERMFFVTLLLNEFISWMRRQSGTSSLRSLLVMDEIAGYFPPIAMPPSKTPMLTLLKQARAYGVGVVLTTQNPIDLDYKGLSNCGTWFIGKLQTDRDKARVIEGLQVASNGEIDAKELDKMLANLGNRTFIMRSIYEKEPILFQTRWTLSYLRGPLTLTQIATLVNKSRSKPTPSSEIPSDKMAISKGNGKPTVPLGIHEFFVSRPEIRQPFHYKPQIVGIAKLHFVDSKTKTDIWQNVCIIAPVDKEGKTILWDDGVSFPEGKNVLRNEGVAGCFFEDLPTGLMQEKTYSESKKNFVTSLFQFQAYKIYRSSDHAFTSREGESEADFRVRVVQVQTEQRDALIKKIKEGYSKKIASMSDKVKRAQEKLMQKQQDVGIKKAETWLSFGTTLLGALFGRKITKGTISEAGTSLRRVGRIGKENQEATSAEEECKACQQQLDDLQKQMNAEIARVSLIEDANSIKLEEIVIKPRKGDITIEEIALVWLPVV
jgi:hypothetical protein